MATLSNKAYAKIAYRVFNFVVLISLCLSNLAFPKMNANAADIKTEENPSNKVDESGSTYSPPKYTHPQARTISRSSETDLDSQSSVAECSGSSSMMFIENVGQFDSRERFEVKGSKGVVRATSDGILISLFEPPTSMITPTMNSQDEVTTPGIAPTPQPTPSPESLKDEVTEGVNLKLSFEGANIDPSIIGFNRLETKVSYFIGNDSDNWHPDVPVWGGIRYLNIYDGYDLEITGDCGQWTWTLDENLTTQKDQDYFPSSESNLSGSSSDTGEIRLKVEGSENLEVTDENLNISTNMGEIKFPLPQQGFSRQTNQKPLQSQNSNESRINGDEIILPFSFLQKTKNGDSNQSPSSFNKQPQSQETSNDIHGGLHFANLAPVNKKESKVSDLTYSQSISDTINFSTFFGGNNADYIDDIKVDSQGNIYISSKFYGTDFPTEYGAYTINASSSGNNFGIYKFNPTGSDLIYLTIVGKIVSQGFGWYYSSKVSIDIDSSNQVYIAGTTQGNFPVINAYDDTSNGIVDAFLCKLDNSGTSLLFSTYLGGWMHNIAMGIDVTESEVVITGYTTSFNFPTTANAFATTLNFDDTWLLYDPIDMYWGSDVFISIFDTSGNLTYSTYLGGDSDDIGTSIIVQNDTIYLTGITYSNDFPGASGSSYNGTYGWVSGNNHYQMGTTSDEFVSVFNSGSLAFSTYIGGSSNDCYNYSPRILCDIAISQNGDIYITGGTYSSDFPLSSPFDSSFGGSTEAYLAKFSNSGQLIFSTFLGGNSTDYGNGIAVDNYGLVYLAGSSSSSDFIITDYGYDQSQNGSSDAYLSIWSPDGFPIYDTFLGGSGSDIGSDVVISETGKIYLTGYTNSSDFPLSSNAFDTSLSGSDGFFTAFTLPYLSIIAKNQINSKCPLPDECELANAIQSTGTFGDPIVTSTGQFFYNNQDISISLPSQSLIFARTYSSFATDIFSTTMGYGWTHSLDKRLILPDDLLGVEGYIRFKASSTNIYDYIEKNDGSYYPMPGVVGILTYTSTSPVTYTLTLPSQINYTFDEEGELQIIENSTGQKMIYTYNEDDQLTRVADENNARYIDLSYNIDGYVSNISDYTSREITFTYNTSGDLVSYLDLQGQTWQYEYDNDHNMTRIIDPDNNTITETEYDASGRAIKQWDALGNQIVDITFNNNGSVTLENSLEDTQTHIYDGRGTMVGDVIGTGITTTKQYDRNFNPIKITDPSGQSTEFEWSDDGVNLTYIEDSAGNQTEISYDNLNNPTEVVDALDHLTTYDYDGKLLTHTTDALGEVITYTYTEEGYLESVTNPLTQTTTYAYDEFGQRTAITNSLGITTTYEYDDLGRVINTTDSLGRVSHTEYDNAGRVVKSVRNYNPLRPQNDDNQYNIVTTYAYDVRGNQIAITDTYTNTTQYIYNDAGLLINTINPLGHTITNTYNEAGQLITVTNALGDKTSYVYDEAGRQTAVIDALGNSTHTVYNPNGTIANSIDALGHVITYTYDSLDRLIATTDELSGVTTSQYDALGNVITSTNALGDKTTYEYDALGRLIKQTDSLGGETEYFYDEVGNRVQTIDPRDHATTYTYDDANRLVKVTDALGSETQYEYDDLGRQAAIIDDEGNRTEYAFDALDRVIAVTDPLTRTTSTQYDALGNVLSVTDANDNTTSYVYDDLYRQIQQTDALSGTVSYTYDALGNRLTSTDANDHTTTFQYDALGRNIVVTDPLTQTTYTYYDAVGQVISTTNALGKTAYFEYDELGRQISITDPNGSVTEQSYDAAGNLVSTTDANDVVTHYEYDKLGHLTAVVENYKPGYSANNETNVRTEYTYDENGNRLSIKDANDHTTIFVYDELNRVIEESDPLENTWTYTYDSLGRKATVTDANNITAAYIYDDAGQLTGIDYPGITSDVSFTYDSGGRRIQMVDSLGATTWDYDDLNRIISVTDPFTQTVGYTYDATGNRTGLTYPDTKAVSYAYNSANQLTDVTDWNSQVTQYSYDPVGRLLSVLRPNGVDTSYSYNDGGQLTQLQHAYQSSPVATFQYNYDSVGNRTSVSENYRSPEPDSISNDNFENGGISGWNASSIDEGDLSVTSASGLEGVYGLQAVIDDTTDLWVEDIKPSNESHYRARFYFDPNSIIMPTNSTMDLFYGKNSESVTIVNIQLRSLYGEYQLKVSTLDDNENWIDSYWFPLSDDAHAIEFEWLASSSSINYDGECNLWIDGEEVSAFGEINNYSQRIETIQLGALSISTSQISGSIFIDDFISRRSNYIGLNSSIPVPELPDLIFENNWETGDLINWSSVISTNENLSATSEAAVYGNFGMQATIDDDNELYVRDESPLNDEQYHARFYFNPNLVNIPTGENFSIFKALNINTGNVFSIPLRIVDDEYQIRVEVEDDNQITTGTSWIDIANQWYAFEIGWQSASNSYTPDGQLKFWIDGKLIAQLSGLDTSSKNIDSIELGVISPSASTISGTPYFDEFVSNRTGYIGINSNILTGRHIFSDAFESGDFIEWSSIVTDSGDLTVSSLAAIEGSFGLTAAVDDEHDLFVKDNSPVHETTYHARFYLDPYSLKIPAGETIHIFEADDKDSGTTLTITLRLNDGHFQVQALAANDDSQSPSSTMWASIRDGINILEVEWVRSTEPLANDGYLHLLVNDLYTYQVSSLDNDTKFIDSINLGVISPTTSTITGVVFFDDFTSNNTGYIGQNSEVTLPPISEILADHFESSNLIRWDEVISGDGDLSVSSQASMEGNYGLQAVVDDGEELYLTDLNPWITVNKYFTLFYFDPNSITIPMSDTITIFQTLDETDATALTLQLRQMYDEYQIRASAIDDSQQITSTHWIALTDEPHAIELYWKTSTQSEANDGNLNIYLDDIEKWSLSNLDNDTIHIDTAQMGVISPTASTITGTIFFDDFNSNWYTYIPLNINIPNPESPYLIFDDDFESGDFSAWTDVVTDNDDLRISSGGTIEGGYQLHAVINDQNDLYVYDESPLSNNTYDMRFYFDTNSVIIPQGEYFDIIHATDNTTGLVLRARLQQADGQYQIAVGAEDDNQQITETSWYGINDGIHFIEIKWSRASGLDANNGFIKLWLDDDLKEVYSGIDCYNKLVDSVQIGVLSPSTNTISGNLFFDVFASQKDEYIGPDPNVNIIGNLFSDDFESGNFSIWSDVFTDTGDLSITPTAAKEGYYGMQAYIDDDSDIWVQDNHPDDEINYNKRFYFDPNSINIPAGSSMDIFRAYDINSESVYTISLRPSLGDEYQLLVSTLDDNDQETSSLWIPITDETHAIEVDWQAASEVGANDGTTNIWIDDIQKDQITGLDNDIKSIDYIQMGVLSPSTNTITGTVFFDDFDSNNSGYIGLNSNIQAPEIPEVILSDAFESGDFSAWTGVITDSNDLVVTTTAAIEGSYGMLANIDDQTDIYVIDGNPMGDTSYHARFYFDPNSISIPSGEYIDILQSLDPTSSTVNFVRLSLIEDADNPYMIQIGLIDDAGLPHTSSLFDISNDHHAIEIEWQTSLSRDSNDGHFKLWIDGVEKTNLGNIDIYSKRIDVIKFGALSISNSAIAGAMRFDDFVSNRTGYIGLNPNILPPGQLFADSFESGDFSAWSTIITDTGDLSVTTSVSLDGDYVMEALINDDNDIYVQDSIPDNEVNYYKRFYFDPNSVNIPAGSSMDIFRAYDINSESVYTISLRPSFGDEYQLIVSTLDDNDQKTSSLWIPITDETHAIEINWQAASETGANDGETTIWLDDNQIEILSGIDNDTKSIDYIRMGVLSPSTTTITGTVFFDDFDSNNNGYIGLNSNIEAPEIPEVILSDAFESGDFSSWTDVITDSNDLYVSSSDVIEGSYSMQATINDQSEIYVIDSHPLGDTSYHARFYFDPNSISIPTEEYLDLIQSLDTNSSLANYVRLRSVDGQYQIQAGAVDDNQQTYNTSWINISDERHAIEIEWHSSTEPSIGDGNLKLWIDGVNKENIRNLDIYVKRVDAIKFGALSISDSSIAGSILYDDFVSNRTGYIGLNTDIFLPYIFDDAFESGDFIAWSDVITDSGDLTITGIAPIEGNYSLKAVVNDTNDLWVEDDSPYQDYHYYARFYFDPYSISIPENEYITIFQGIDENSNPVLYVRLQELDEYFQVQAVAIDDNQESHESDWVSLEDGTNMIEFEWYKAWNSSTPDGFFDLWINGENNAGMSSLDNDTKYIDTIQLGVFSPSTTTVSGTVFFDDFDSNRDYWPEQNPEVSLLSVSQIFADYFETGEYARWDEALTGNEDLSVSSQAAILGNYGLQAVIDDNEEIYLTDLNPDSSYDYLSLFYFDPNSVSIPSGETLNLYQLKDETDATILTLQLRQVYGEYQISASTLDDNQQITYSRWFAITDEAHAIGIYWFTALEAEANNGFLNIYLDDAQVWSINSLDNDTRFIDIAQLGVISPTTSTISGTIFFDDYDSDDWDYIYINPNFNIPEVPEDIFEDDFESGDFSAWSTAITDSGDLSVSSAAAIQDSYGMQAVIDDQNDLFVYDESPWGNTYYQVRFYFDPNLVYIPQYEHIDIFHANDATTGLVYRVRLRQINGNYMTPDYQIAAAVEDDSNQITETSYYDIDDAPVSIQVEFATASDWDAYDGHIKLWLDDELQEEVFDVDNFTKRIDNIQLGVMSPSTSTIAGTVYFDDLDSNRTGYIGYRPQNRILAFFDLRQWLHKAGEFISGLFNFIRPEQAAQPSYEEAQPKPQFSETQPEYQEAAIPDNISTLSGKSVLANYMLPNPPQTTLSSPLATLNEQEMITVTRTITYTYDPLNRLTAADYNDNTYYHYTYDAVGNRLSQVTNSSSITYTYDIANRLTNTNGITYTWDANGNLLSDGINLYNYDLANRLTAFDDGENVYYYAYNGLGDRLQQTYNGVTTTNYTIDMASGLTQVLSDGTNTYLYGVDRISQHHNTTTEYFLADALGSVRQLTASTGEVVLARAYDPYGNLVENNAYDGVTSAYGYGGEYTDSSGMVYLRARYYSPAQGRFVSRDVWEGDYNNPLSLNKWGYAYANPINYTDPTGKNPIQDYISALRENTEECYNNRDLSCIWRNYYQISVGGKFFGYIHAGNHLQQFLFKQGDIRYSPYPENFYSSSEWLRTSNTVQRVLPARESQITELIRDKAKVGLNKGTFETKKEGVDADMNEIDVYYSLNDFFLWTDVEYEITNCNEIVVRPTYYFRDDYNWHSTMGGAGGALFGVAGFQDAWAKALVDAGLAKEYRIKGSWFGPNKKYIFPSNWLDLDIPMSPIYEEIVY